MSMVTLSFFNEKSIDYCNLSLVFQLPVYSDPAGYQHPGNQDWQILHTAATFLASMPIHTGKGGILFPHPERNIIRKICYVRRYAKRRHLQRTVTETIETISGVFRLITC